MMFDGVIERLNLWGDQIAHIAWPLFWQSSILIAGMFILDFFLRRRLRPSVRHALWLVVVVKLLLPPSFAMPSGIGWWLRPREVAPAKPPVASYVVTYGSFQEPRSPASRDEEAPSSLPVLPPVRLSTPTRVLLASAALSATFFIVILVRWRLLRQQLRKSQAAPIWLQEMVHDTRRKARCRRRVRLMLTDASISPALCGLFRPVIVLPSALVQQLRPEQLRAVLLHELFHLRNGDVWVNCFQSLLQIAFWWHPFLWLANARIRRIREEVVDDAVRLALGEEAESYAPTLLEVARLALARPLATLGLVGILESRNALKQRVDRLVNFPAPRRAGLSIVSGFAILAFAGVALPMGQAPPKAVDSVRNSIANTGIGEKQRVAETITPGLTVQPKTDTGWVDFDFASGVTTATNGAVLTYGDTSISADSITLNQQTGEVVAEGFVTLEKGAVIPLGGKFHSNVTRLFAQNQPSVTNPPRRISTSSGKRVIMNKLEAIRLNHVFFDNLPLSEVVNYLQGEAKKRDPEGKGINFILNPNTDLDGVAGPPTIDPATGLTVPPPQVEPADINGVAIRISPPLDDVRMLDVLDAIIKVANPRLRYSIEDYGISFRVAGNATPVPLFTRVIKVDPNIFAQGLESVVGFSVGNFQTGGQGGGGQQGNSSGVTVPRVQVTPNTIGGQGGQGGASGGAQGGAGGISGVTRPTTIISPQAARQFFVNAGVDLTPPKSVFFDDRTGTLLVHAALNDLDIIEQAVGALSTRAATGAQPATTRSSATPSNPVSLATNQAKLPVLGDLPLVGSAFQVRTAQVAAVNSPRQMTNAVNVGPGDKLLTRVIKIEPGTFLESLKKAGNLPDNASSQDIITAFRKILLDSGLELQPPKNIFFNEYGAALLVRATAQDLEFIESFVQVLNLAPPQVTIRAKFVEANEEASKLVFDEILFSKALNGDGRPLNAGTNVSLVAILTDSRFQELSRIMQERAGFDLLAEQNVTTLSGRQAQIQNADIQSIVKLNPQALVPPGIVSSNLYTSTPMAFGPVLNITPAVATDGTRMSLSITAQVTEFLGNDAALTGEPVPIYVDGKTQSVNPPLPRIRIRELHTASTIEDGQTVVLSKLSDTMIKYDKNGKAVPEPNKGNKDLFVFVTATLIDPAGNPIHSGASPPLQR
jgi:beta-lactamase regulating signal transducer with metallopeptidase domain